MVNKVNIETGKTRPNFELRNRGRRGREDPNGGATQRWEVQLVRSYQGIGEPIEGLILCAVSVLMPPPFHGRTVLQNHPVRAVIDQFDIQYVALCLSTGAHSYRRITAHARQ